MIALVKNLPRHLSASSVERVDLDAEGRRVLTLCDGPAATWWVESAAGWTPTGPHEDQALPFAATVTDELARSGSRLIAWKPGRRLVLVAQRAAGPIVLKAQRKRGYERAREAQRFAERALAGSEWRAAALLGERRELACLEFAFEAGAPLALDESASSLCFRLGAGLRSFQRAAGHEGLSAHGASDEVQVVEHLRRRAEALDATLPGDFAGAQARLSASGARLPNVELAPCHRDLHDGQFLQAEKRLVCLDFDLVCRADPALDPANFVAHLQLRAMQEDRGATRASALELARSFLEGLDRDAEADFGARLCWYQAATFLRLAAVHAMRPRWLHLAPELTALSVRCMEDLERA